LLFSQDHWQVRPVNIQQFEMERSTEQPMRISTAQTYDASIDTLMRRQREMSDAQVQLTSGKRLIRASDDPAAAARAERALAAMARVDASQRGVQASEAMMVQTEAALGDAGGLLQQAREALVAAGNGSYTDSERQTLSAELRSIRGQLLGVANRSDGGHGFMFGGQGSAQPPFVDAAAGVQFRGTSGQAAAADGEGLPLTADGNAIWQSTRTGNGVFETRVNASTGSAWVDGGRVTDPSALTGSIYTIAFTNNAGTLSYSILKDGAATAQTNLAFSAGAGGTVIEVDGMASTFKGVPGDGDSVELRPSTPTLSVFDALDKAVADLAAPGQSVAARTQHNLQNLNNVDAVLSRLVAARAQAGDTLNRIDHTGERLSAQKLQARSERSNAEDLDMAGAISEFQSRQSGYDAALKSYSMVQRLSLFNYVNV
jgi:flagellar hook-associated protein 3 FlgL